ncbi:MAG: chromosomal replication initiator protein DnaA [Deltaproteobacteria bacterium]|nr:chromosomal replication initiator protein DnaA [Deltaproteobacteria bacterium]
MQAWEKALEVIRGKVNAQVFEAWFAPISFEECTDDTLSLRVPNKFFKEWLSNNYIDLIEEAMWFESGNRLRISFAVAETDGDEIVELTPRASVTPKPAASTEYRLNPRYTFESFVVGSSNQLPHAASVAVTEMMGTKYNPLFIYGGVGLGKTHLVHAIGNAIRGKTPSVRICYISSEQFMNEFVFSLRNDKMDTFRKRFRKECDVLLMDDIQFIAGKDRTQDEFFHTFNSLYEQNKQIVLTSDKYPQEIPDLEERLRSRFQWGLIADIQPPELETRLAILNKKAEDEGIPLPNDVALFLASSIKSNVRELEGSLINLAAHASLEGCRIDIAFAKETLKKVIALHQAQLTVEGVQAAVCKHFNVSMVDMTGANRQRSISLPRQIAMYLCRKGLNASFPEIGGRFGGKDHTTAMAACRKIEQLVTEDVTMRSKVEALERLLGF